ncbi:MAG: hypothetical protein VX529_01115 [Pseudomonadota bacterium]|jgi:membrane-anchored glycerophosphoryl diester phosphodiesterase (GDPDase)|nr:hypothetical protein [Pseudomonadota bacterium]
MRQTSRASLYAAAICLVSFLVAYAWMWLTAILAVLIWNWTGTVAGLDIPNIVRSLSSAERVLVIAACIFIAVTLVCMLLRRRFALYTAYGTLLSHCAAWLLMADNPYYSGQPGFLLLPLEGLAIALIALLIRRQTLR